MDRQQEATSIVSKMNLLVKEFIKKPQKTSARDNVESAIEKICVGQRLLDLQKAVDDVLRDAELSSEGLTQEDLDLLISYYKQAESLTQGRA